MTSDGTESGIPLKWRLREEGADWSKWLTTSTATNEGSVETDFDRTGGASDTYGMVLDFLAEFLPDATKAALRTQADARATLVAVDLTLAETDENGDEINLAFSLVKWVKQPVGASDYDFVAPIYEGVAWRMVVKE